MKKYIILVLVLFTPVFVSAHPGRTDSSGCHTCKTNCPNWGLSYSEYHCHNTKGGVQPIEPVKSTYGESGTGYTTPAPEYKAPQKNIYVPTVTKTKEVSKVKIATSTVVVSDVKVEKKGWFSGFFGWMFK